MFQQPAKETINAVQVHDHIQRGGLARLLAHAYDRSLRVPRGPTGAVRDGTGE
ncbi:hypothetical protein [Oryzomonas sagensis]|uniref:hypothetical protein n=1 Tax=Oryzomonas sagensis TaxID=2603857 RepID=UPI003B8471F2